MAQNTGSSNADMSLLQAEGNLDNTRFRLWFAETRLSDIKNYRWRVKDRIDGSRSVVNLRNAVNNRAKQVILISSARHIRSWKDVQHLNSLELQYLIIWDENKLARIQAVTICQWYIEIDWLKVQREDDKFWKEWEGLRYLVDGTYPLLWKKEVLKRQLKIELKKKIQESWVEQLEVVTPEMINDLLRRMDEHSRKWIPDTVEKTDMKIFSVKKKDEIWNEISQSWELEEFLIALNKKWDKSLHDILEEIADMMYYLSKHQPEEYTPWMARIYDYIQNNLVDKLWISMDVVKRILYTKYSIRMIFNKMDLSEEDKAILGGKEWIKWSMKWRKEVLKPTEREVLERVYASLWLKIKADDDTISAIIMELQEISNQHKKIQAPRLKLKS